MIEIAQIRRRSSPVVWHPNFGRGAASASLAANAEVTILDETLDHPTSGEDYGPGALVGVRLWVKVYPAAEMLSGIVLVKVLVLPAGLAVPVVSGAGTLVQNQKYVWAMVPLTSTVVATTARLEGMIHLSTVRRIERGDRFVLVLQNLGTVAYGAAAEETYALDAYIRED